MAFTEEWVGNNRKYYENTMKKNGEERILCAAVWYQDLPLKIEIPDNRVPYNLNRGIVFCGHRHPHCMWTMVAITGLSHSEVGNYISGFLTNCNRFVDRIEAGKIAWAARQLEENPFWGGEWHSIYSEDLY